MSVFRLLSEYLYGGTVENKSEWAVYRPNSIGVSFGTRVLKTLSSDA
jgi:hypothetical protein